MNRYFQFRATETMCDHCTIPPERCMDTPCEYSDGDRGQSKTAWPDIREMRDLVKLAWPPAHVRFNPDDTKPYWTVQGVVVNVDWYPVANYATLDVEYQADGEKKQYVQTIYNLAEFNRIFARADL